MSEHMMIGNPLGYRPDPEEPLEDVLLRQMRMACREWGVEDFASEGFLTAVAEIVALHVRKSRDYGRRQDPYYNVRASVEWGVPGWVGSLVRANDKVKRLQLAAQGNKLANEGIEDSLLDLATYALIGLVLWRQDEEG